MRSRGSRRVPASRVCRTDHSDAAQRMQVRVLNVAAVAALARAAKGHVQVSTRTLGRARGRVSRALSARSRVAHHIRGDPRAMPRAGPSADELDELIHVLNDGGGASDVCAAEQQPADAEVDELHSLVRLIQELDSGLDSGQTKLVD